MRWLAIVALLAASPVSSVLAAPSDEEQNRPTALTLSLAGTRARMVARFAIEVEGPGVALNTVMLSIPPNSLVTSGAVVVDGKRVRLRLDKAEDATRSFDALTLKPGKDGDRAWALVVDGGADHVMFDVLAPRAAKLVVELKLDASTCFFRDRRYVMLPVDWWQRLPAAQRNTLDRDDVAEACSGISPADDDHARWVGFSSDHLAKQPPGERRIGTIAGRIALDTTHFARVDVELSRTLTTVPRDLHTAIVVDHSASMSTDELEAQRAIVAAYLRAAPASRVQVIGYARKAEPLLPSWMMASHAGSRIDAAIRSLPPRNGSNLDDALREAAVWLARAQGTKRIVLFSDERLARRFDEPAPIALRELLTDDTLVHVVQPNVGVQTLIRHDGLLAPLAAATRGIEVLGGSSEDDHPIDATMLVRPTSLDQIEITAEGWKRADELVGMLACNDTLREGESCTWWGEGLVSAGPVTVTGLLWNTPFKRVVRPDPSQARALARTLSVMQALETVLQAQVDRIAAAVNPVWSLFGQWGGKGGYEDIGGFGTIGMGRFGSRSHDSGTGTSGFHMASPRLDLTAQLTPVIQGCKPGETYVTIALETTLQEIVAHAVTVKPFDRVLYDCIVEAVWDTTLRIPNSPPHATAHVAFGNKR